MPSVRRGGGRNCVRHYGGRCNVCGRSIIMCARCIHTWPAEGAASVRDSSRGSSYAHYMRANSSRCLLGGRARERERKRYEVSLTPLSVYHSWDFARAPARGCIVSFLDRFTGREFCPGILPNRESLLRISVIAQGDWNESPDRGENTTDRRWCGIRVNRVQHRVSGLIPRELRR